MTAPNVFRTTEGRQFTVKLRGEDETFTVGPKCETGTQGQWRCLTHAEGFAAQMEKDSHVARPGDHELVWVCIEHGPEVP